MPEPTTEIAAANPSTKGSEKPLKTSFPQYRQGAEMPGVEPILKINKALSHESKIKLESESGKTQASDRTLALRRVRRELVEKVKKTQNVEERRDLIAQGHAKDELAEQYMSGQKEVTVTLGDLGEQMAPYVVLTPPETRRSEAQDGKPPIFMLVSISSGLESMGMLPQELAFEGRKVVVIGFPESWKGEATDAFGKATEESKSYEPHTTFFKEAIKAIMEKQEFKDKIGDTSEIDLWGYSAGAAIVAEILTDQKFREQVANAAIIAPPNCIDQDHVVASLLHDLLQVVRPKNIKDAAKLNATNRHDIQYTEDHRKRMLRTFNALEKKVLRRNNWWKNDLRVRDGGKIKVVSYDNDHSTQSYEAVDEIAQNPNLTVIELPGSHNTPLTEPENVIKAIAA